MASESLERGRCGSKMPLWPLPRWLCLLLLIFILKQTLAVVVVPPFSGHDEVAHLTYARILANEGRIPTLPDLESWRQAQASAAMTTDDDSLLPGDDLPDDLYPWCRFVLDWYCAPDEPLWSSDPPHVVTVSGEYFPSGFVYTANHPPFYYATMAPLIWMVAELPPVWQQALLRLWAIPFGLAVVVCGWIVPRVLFGGDQFLAISIPLALAFQPQISYEAGLINNDIAGIAAASVVFTLIVIAMRDQFPLRVAFALGVSIGLGMLTRSNVAMVVPVTILAVLSSLGPSHWRSVCKTLVVIGAVALALVAPWWWWMYSTYGSIDGLNRIGELQGWWNIPEGSFLQLLTSPEFHWLRFKETWGEYGWRLIHLDGSLLFALAAVSLLCVIGLAMWGLLVARDSGAPNDAVEHPEPWQVQTVLVLFSACVVGYLAVVQFGTAFALTQARYYFPVALPVAVLCMLGLRTICPVRWRPWAPFGLLIGWTALTLLLLFGYVLPFHDSIVAEMRWIT